MCSIIVAKANKDFKKNVKEYMLKLSHRGKDEGCGILAHTSKGMMRLKSMKITDVVDYVQTLENNTLVIIHQRKASVGTINIENAHPVVSDNKQVNVIHNGTRKIYKELWDASSDSQGLATLLSITEQHSHEKIMRELGVVFYTYKGKLYFYKDALRPLVKSKRKAIMSSEPLFDGEWATVDEVEKPHPFNFDKEAVSDYKDIKLTKGDAKYCYNCKKIHLPSTRNVCGVCAILGKGTDYTYPIANSITTKTEDEEQTFSVHFQNYHLQAGKVYKITKDVIIKSEDKSKVAYNGDVCHVFGNKTVTRFDKYLYVNLERGSMRIPISVHIEKFGKLNKLIEDKTEAPAKKPIATIRKDTEYLLTRDMINNIGDKIGIPEEGMKCFKSVDFDIYSGDQTMWIHTKDENGLKALTVNAQRFLEGNNLIEKKEDIKKTANEDDIIFTMVGNKLYNCTAPMFLSAFWKSASKEGNLKCYVEKDTNIKKGANTVFVNVTNTSGMNGSLSIDVEEFLKVHTVDKTKETSETFGSNMKALPNIKRFENLDKCYECSGRIAIPVGTDNWGWCKDCRAYLNRHEC